MNNRYDKSDAIILRNLVTGYQDKRGMKVISNGINATLRAGELTCLLGPNGSGKSTLLRTLCRFQEKLGGEVEIWGKQMESYSQEEFSRVTGVVLTDKIMVSNMTVKELVELGRSPYTGFWGRLREDDKEIVCRAMRLTGIEMLAERGVSTLSDGERQKALISKVLAQETDIVFLDEPTAFLDYPSKIELMRLLHRLCRMEDKTIFMSCHDLELALQIADSLWLLDRNLGLETGTTETLVENGSLGRYFNREGITFDVKSRSFRISEYKGAEG